jgi:hypothetical protein
VQVPVVARTLTRNDPAEAGSRAVKADVFDQENDWPQPQVRVTFGLLMVKPASCSPSL